MITTDDIKSGYVWESRNKHIAVTQWIDSDQWILIDRDLSPAEHGGTCRLVFSRMTSDGYKCIVTREQMAASLECNGWRRIT